MAERSSLAAHQPGPQPRALDAASIRASDLWSGERRLEGETYLTEGYRVRARIETSLPFSYIRDLASVWQPSRLKGIPVSPDHGTPYLTATQVFDIQPRPRKWLAAGRTSDLSRRFVEPGWILLTRSGSVGDAIVTYSALSNAIVSDDLLRIQLHEQAQLGYLYTFIRTRFGRAMLRSTRYGSIVKHLEPEHVMEIPVPKASQSDRSMLNSEVAGIFALREEALELIRLAEDRFASELGPLDDSSPRNSIRASEFFSRRRRLDAEYHVSTSLHLEKAKVDPLGSMVDDVLLPNRFRRVYMESGIPYLDSEDIFKVNPEVTKFIPPSAMPNARAYSVDAGWLLVARSGQTYGLSGSVILANTWHAGKIVSEHIIRIIPQKGGVRAGYLQIALGHPVYSRPLMKRLAFGSQVPEIAPEDLKRFPIIRMPASVEDAIADDVERASSLRLKADQIENAIVEQLEASLSALDATTTEAMSTAPKVVKSSTA
jgi:hypothetical protein